MKVLVFEHANVKVNHNELNLSAYVELNVCDDPMLLVNEFVYMH